MVIVLVLNPTEIQTILNLNFSCLIVVRDISKIISAISLFPTSGLNNYRVIMLITEQVLDLDLEIIYVILEQDTTAR